MSRSRQPFACSESSSSWVIRCLKQSRGRTYTLPPTPIIDHLCSSTAIYFCSSTIIDDDAMFCFTNFRFRLSWFSMCISDSRLFWFAVSLHLTNQSSRLSLQSYPKPIQIYLFLNYPDWSARVPNSVSPSISTAREAFRTLGSSCRAMNHFHIYEAIGRGKYSVRWARFFLLLFFFSSLFLAFQVSNTSSVVIYVLLACSICLITFPKKWLNYSWTICRPCTKGERGKP